MKFGLRRPCGHCPFRTDVVPFLTAKRAVDLARDLSGQGACSSAGMGPGLTFTCHETIERLSGKPPEQHCAGALIMLAKARLLWDNQMLRLAAGLRIFDAARLDLDAPVYESPDAFVKAHRRSR